MTLQFSELSILSNILTILTNLLGIIHWFEPWPHQALDFCWNGLLVIAKLSQVILSLYLHFYPHFPQ